MQNATSRVALGAFLFAVTYAGRARAGNADSFYYSDDAALTAGAVVATTRDAGAIWYNPAGLGGNTRGEINFNGTALGFRIRSVPSALSTTVPGSGDGHRASLDSSDFFSTPHALTYIKSLSPSVSIGAALYVTSFDLRNAESQASFAGTSPAQGATDPGTYQQRLDYALAESVYHLGPALGVELAPNLRVGLALFGTYGKIAGFSQYTLGFTSSGASPPTTVGFVLAQDRELFTYIGARAAAGVQWDPAEAWHLGATVRSPELLLTSSDDGVQLENTALVAPGTQPSAAFALANPKTPFSAFDVVTPMRVLVSVAHDLAPRTWVSVEGDVQTGVTTPGIEQNFTWNARVGVHVQVSDTLALGGGLFTDRATEANVAAGLGADKVDYYGATLGVQLLTPLSLVKKPAPDALVLSTTLAARYAMGFGEARAADIDVTGGNPPARTVSVLYHEIVPYIGSGVLF